MAKTPADALLDELDDERVTTRGWSSIFRRINGVSVVDLVDRPPSSELPFARDAILLVLMLAVTHRASELRFEPCRSNDGEGHAEPGLKLTYQVDGVFYGLVSPPAFCWPRMVSEFEAIAGFTTLRRRLASRLDRLACKIDGQPHPGRQGRFLLRGGEETFEVKLVAFPAEDGEHIQLLILPVSATFADQARLAWEKYDDSAVEAESLDPSTGSDSLTAEDGEHPAIDLAAQGACRPPDQGLGEPDVGADLGDAGASPVRVPSLEGPTSMDESIADIDVTLAPGKASAPLFRHIDGVNVIQLIGNPDFPELKSHRLLIYLLMMIALKDRSSSIQIEPCSVDYEEETVRYFRMFSEVEGKLRELVPCPRQFNDAMIREFEAMAGLISYRHRLASGIRFLAWKLNRPPLARREGRFRLRAHDESIDVKLIAWPSDSWGARIFLTLGPISPDFSDRVRREMKRLDLLVEGTTRNYVLATPPTRGDDEGVAQPSAPASVPDTE